MFNGVRNISYNRAAVNVPLCRGCSSYRSNYLLYYNTFYIRLFIMLELKTGQVGLGVGSWPSNRATEGSNPKGTRLYFVILIKNVEKIFY